MSAGKLIGAFILSFCLVSAASAEPFFSYRLVQDKTEKRGVFWRPVISLFLPGFDQWIEQQYRSAAVYSGYALLGAVSAASANRANLNSDVTKNLNDDQRRYVWGNQAILDAGFVSSFHSFRKAAETHKPDGEYVFLTHEETTDDLLVAPFHVQYLARPSITVPLGLLIAVEVADARSSSIRYDWRDDDVLFGGALSMGAGVSEEAFFRGEMMPMLYESWRNRFWSDTTTATLFAAAHISPSNRVPWPQFVLGWYLGWLTQKSEWQISPSVFLHTWWDVIAITSGFANNRGQSIYLPLIDLRF